MVGGLPSAGVDGTGSPVAPIDARARRGYAPAAGGGRAGQGRGGWRRQREGERCYRRPRRAGCTRGWPSRRTASGSACSEPATPPTGRGSGRGRRRSSGWASTPSGSAITRWAAPTAGRPWRRWRCTPSASGWGRWSAASTTARRGSWRARPPTSTASAEAASSSGWAPATSRTSSRSSGCRTRRSGSARPRWRRPSPWSAGCGPRTARPSPWRGPSSGRSRRAWRPVPCRRRTSRS